MQLSGRGRVVTAVAAAVAALTGPSVGAAVGQLVGDDFPTALTALLQLTALAVSTWVLLVAAAGSLQLRLPGVPLTLRALLFTGIVVSATTLPAQAGSHDLDGLPLPDRPVSSAITRPDTAPTVTVRAGDTLWALAAARLPDRATAADVSAASADWHRTNRDVIGPDPDLIHPGQVLVPPTHAEDAS